jgi:peptide/nickel transport system permease protein
LANSATLNADAAGAPRSGRSRTVRAAIRPWLTPKTIAGGVIVLILITVGLSAPLIAPYDPNAQNLARVLRPPDWLFGPNMLGTDAVGRDILSRLFYGARVSLVIAVLVVIISGLVGVVLGAISGYFAGPTDFLIQKLVEVVWAFPPLLLAIAIMAFLGQGLENLILALVSQRWIAYCRVSRGQALSLRAREFVDAARLLGANHTRIITRHIMPNLFPSAVVIGTFSMASAIIAEAALSFLGLGVPPDIPTWGSMLADGRTYISTSWWLALFPGLCIFFTVLGINLLGDGLRDILDPRLKRSGSGIG